MTLTQLPLRYTMLMVLGITLGGVSFVFAQGGEAFDTLKTSLQPLIDSAEYSNVSQAAQATADWVESLKQDTNLPQLSDLSSDELSWLLGAMTWTGPNAEGSFSATWKGQIKPSIGGEYTFLISPFNIFAEYENEKMEQWMTVTIDGKLIINASPQDWVYESQAVNLRAGEFHQLEVTYRYLVADDDNPVRDSASAFLFWKGPGIAKSIVPSSVLFTPDGTKNGLLAEYRRGPAGGGGVIATLVEPVLEHVWLDERNFICPHLDTQKQAIAEIWSRMTDPGRWDTIKATDLVHRPVVGSPFDHAGYLTCQQRSEFVDLLVSRPDLLGQLNLYGMTKLFSRFRHGVDEPASKLFGSWMQLHPNVEPILTSNFFGENRNSYRNLVIQFLWQDRRALDLLQEGYLELDDGTCCLPVAYTLAYGYLLQGESRDPHLVQSKIEEWIVLLDAKLDDDLLTGDRRVNWLIARAMAEEIRRGPPKRDTLGRERLTSGRGWLDEAALIADSASVQLRVAKELIARFTAIGQWQYARELLQVQVPTLANQQVLNSWQSDVDAIELAAENLQKEHKINARQAYLNELRRRQQQAAIRGDTSAESRYTALISTVEEVANANP